MGGIYLELRHGHVEGVCAGLSRDGGHGELHTDVWAVEGAA